MNSSRIPAFVENLKAIVHWTGYEWLIGLILITGTGIAFFLMTHHKMKQGLVVLFISSLITVNAASLIIAPRIEHYSQHAAIEFYTYLQGKDCYVETIGFKSYAHLFYSKKQEQKNNNSYDREWLLSGKIDKPTYFVSKIEDIETSWFEQGNTIGICGATSTPMWLMDKIKTYLIQL